MPVNRRKKSTKFRGHTTHGYGSMKKNRGAGNRGGRGNAGSGKRADQRKQSFLKKYGSSYFGRSGFKSKRKKKKSINLREINNNIEKLGKKDGEFHVIDLTKKYDKVLSIGKLDHKVKIKCKSFSNVALEKIEKSGGEIINASAK